MRNGIAEWYIHDADGEMGRTGSMGVEGVGGGVVLAVGAVAKDIICTRNQKAGSSKPCSDGSLHSVPSGYSQGL